MYGFRYQQDPTCKWDGFAFYEKRLIEIIAKGVGGKGGGYERVLVVGDSMGGAGALLFSHLATRVLCFTPQVEVSDYKAINRLDFTQDRRAKFHARVLESVRSSRASITVHYGTGCAEDAQQVGHLRDCKEKAGSKCGSLKLQGHDFDEHVLSVHLKKTVDAFGANKLAPIVDEAIRVAATELLQPSL